MDPARPPSIAVRSQHSQVLHHGPGGIPNRAVRGRERRLGLQGWMDGWMEDRAGGPHRRAR